MHACPFARMLTGHDSRVSSNTTLTLHPSPRPPRNQVDTLAAGDSAIAIGVTATANDMTQR